MRKVKLTAQQTISMLSARAVYSAMIGNVDIVEVSIDKKLDALSIKFTKDAWRICKLISLSEIGFARNCDSLIDYHVSAMLQELNQNYGDKK